MYLALTHEGRDAEALALDTHLLATDLAHYCLSGSTWRDLIDTGFKAGISGILEHKQYEKCLEYNQKLVAVCGCTIEDRDGVRYFYHSADGETMDEALYGEGPHLTAEETEMKLMKIYAIIASAGLVSEDIWGR